MQLRFKAAPSDGFIKTNYSPAFMHALDQLVFGDMQTLRMLEAMETLYSALRNNIIVVSSARYKVECLDFVEVFSDLTPADKETRISPQWERVNFLANAVASAFSPSMRPRVAIEWQAKATAALRGSEDRHE